MSRFEVSHEPVSERKAGCGLDDSVALYLEPGSQHSKDSNQDALQSSAIWPDTSILNILP